MLTNHHDMLEVAFTHFNNLLGTKATHDFTLELEQLLEPVMDLDGLDTPFGAEEIWSTIQRLPARKAPGPDGFTVEFMRACWLMVKEDFVAVFRQLFEL